MKEMNGTTYGPRDRGPAATPKQVCGPVRTTAGPRYGMTVPAMPDAEVAAVIKQGKENPRPLTLDEAKRATRNRAEFLGYSNQLLKEMFWAHTEERGRHDGGGVGPSWDNAVRSFESQRAQYE
jgi:hypothetical protein